MWDQRYSAAEYAYGTQPNDFLKTRFNAINKGKLLSLAEGEGRNAVFLAQQGYAVTAIDGSLAGIDKGRKLAKSRGVEVEFIHADLTDYDLGENLWDGIISIFFPLPSPLRKALYQKVTRALKQNGALLLEAYTPNQLKHGTGGGNSAELMQSKMSLIEELKGLDFEYIQELERNILEGRYHTGTGAVVQAIARKNNNSIRL